MFDTDESGFISFNEFLLAVSALSEGDLSKRLHLAFKIYDINDDRSIDSKEMTKLVEALFDLKGMPKDQRTGENSASSRVKTIFEKLDINEDKTLNEQEFVDGCTNDQFLISLLLPA